MEQFMPNAELKLYITYMDAVGPSLRIYAQIDKDRFCEIKRIINSLSRLFDEGLGVPVPGSIKCISKVTCCARSQQNYYRAKIRSFAPTGKAIVQFIDYGNTEILSLCDIRLLDDISAAQELMDTPPLAEPFIIAGIYAKNGIWDQEHIRRIFGKICFSHCTGVILMKMSNTQLICLQLNDRQDFSEFLIAEDYATLVPIPAQLRLHKTEIHPSNSPQLQIGQSQRESPNIIVKIPITQVAQLGPRDTNTNGQTERNPSFCFPYTKKYQERWSGHDEQSQPNAPPPQNEPPVPITSPEIPLYHQNEDYGVFRSRVLEIDSQHEVTVSHVELNPFMFFVQPSSTEEELRTLMHQINEILTPQPLIEPPTIGTACLGHYSVTKLLHRVIIMEVREDCCKIHYVDYGYIGMLKFTDMYQLPREYMNPRALSIRFIMSNIHELNITAAVKEYLKFNVAGKKVRLHVRSSGKASSLIQYGELYDNDRNIKDVILRPISRNSLAKWQSPYKLLEGFREMVKVAYVDMSTIFVNLVSNTPALVSIKNELVQYSMKTPALESSRIKIGLACIAYSTKECNWFRAEIVHIGVDNVTVCYIDYGDEEIIPMTSVRSVRPGGMPIMKIRSQAIRCVPSNYHEIRAQVLSKSVQRKLMEQPVMMVVKEVTSIGPIVDLLDTKKEPYVNIIPSLKRTSDVIKTGDKRLNTSMDESQSSENSELKRSKKPDDVSENTEILDSPKDKSQSSTNAKTKTG